MLTEHKNQFLLFINNMSPGLGAEMPVFFQYFVPPLSAALQLGLVKYQGQDKLQSKQDSTALVHNTDVRQVKRGNIQAR